VLIVLRDTQSINLVGAYEEPIRAGETGGRATAAIARLADTLTQTQRAYAETPVASWTFGPGERLAPLAALAERGDLNTTVAAVGEAVAARLS
jgi:CRISPR system Cascade subunit CasC